MMERLPDSEPPLDSFLVVSSVREAAEPPSVLLRVDEYARLRSLSHDQVRPWGVSPRAVSLSCNDWGEVWVVTRYGYIRPHERMYVHGQIDAVDEVAELVLARPRSDGRSGGRFRIDLSKAVRPCDWLTLARVELVAG